MNDSHILSLQWQVDEDIRMQHCELGGGTVLSRNEFYTPKSVQPIFRQLWSYTLTQLGNSAQACFDCKITQKSKS